MEIKVTISLDELTRKMLNKLIDTIAQRNAQTTAPTTAAQDDGEWTEEEMREALEDSYAEENAAKNATQDGTWTTNEESSTPARNKANKPASGGVDAPKAGKPKITQEELRALAADVKAKTGSIDKVKALLNAYSAKNISALPADKWDEFAAKLKELL